MIFVKVKKLGLISNVKISCIFFRFPNASEFFPLPSTGSRSITVL